MTDQDYIRKIHSIKKSSTSHKNLLNGVLGLPEGELITKEVFIRGKKRKIEYTQLDKHSSTELHGRDIEHEIVKAMSRKDKSGFTTQLVSFFRK